MKYFGDNSLAKLIALVKDTLSAHTDDTNIHVTMEEKEAWGGAATVDDVVSEIHSHDRDGDSHKDIREEIAALSVKPQASLVTLRRVAWDTDTKTQTVDVAGIDADEAKQMICAMPYSSDTQAYRDADIQMSDQSAGKATFVCKSVPAGNVKAWVVVENVEDTGGAGDVTSSACLTFSSPDSFSIKVNTPGWEGSMEYSTDQSTWAIWDGSEITAVDSGDTYVLYIRGSDNTKVTGASANQWTLTGSNIACSGNIESLLDYVTAGAGNHPQMAGSCYYGMFNGCTGLTSAPSLPAMTLTYACYRCMFYGCTGLTTAPSLPATTLDDQCYEIMFYGCTGLTTVPSLPATTLPTRCYNAMFYGCTGLKFSSTQTGTYTKAYRVPVSGTGTAASDSLEYMFRETGGTFTDDPDLNTTYYLDESNSIV